MNFDFKIRKDFIYIIANIIYIIFIFKAGYVKYINFGFTSDGFHYYSALRNFCEYWSFFEGPTFQYLLGNHTYILFYLLSTIIFVFKTPIVLLYVNILTHIISSYVVYLIANYDLKGLNRIVCYQISFLYLLYPLVYKSFYAGIYLFQPDFFLPPLFLLSVLYLIKINKLKYIICIVLILLIKEEYLILLPYFITFQYIYIYIYQKSIFQIFFNDKCFIKRIIITVFITSILITSTLLFFRSKNTYTHVLILHRKLNYSEILDTQVQTYCEYIFYIILPILPLFLIIKRKHFLLCMIFIILAVVVRLLINIVLYGTIYGTEWANCIIPVFVFLGMILLLSKACMNKRRSVLIINYILLLLYGLVFLNSEYFYNYLHNINTKDIITQDVIDSINNIPKLKNKEYYIVSENLMSRYMKNSHVSSAFLLTLSKSYANSIIYKSSFMLLYNNDSFIQYLNNEKIKFIILKKYNNFIYLKIKNNDNCK